MADIYSPWMASEEEDVTTNGLVTPEFMEMYAEAQEGPGAEAVVDMETEPELVDMPQAMPEANSELMQQAMSTMQQQSNIIDKLLTMLLS